LKDGTLKECGKCNKIKSLDDFKDEKLVNGYGKYCNECKHIAKRSRRRIRKKAPDKPIIKTTVRCPSCNSFMVVRTRRSDGNQFYGCSRFPRCRGATALN